MHKSSTQYARITEASFTPLAWARNAHVQTIYPKFFLKTAKTVFKRVRINTPDNDFLDLGILEPNNDEPARAIVLLFHGLEGSENSHYIQHLAMHLQAHNMISIVMHFRGCSGEPNHQPRAYHSGETSDALHTVAWLQSRYGTLKMFSVGFSLGGNMLLKLLGEHQAGFLEAAVSVSAPIHLAASADAINKGFARRYQAHLLKTMRSNLLEKFKRLDMTLALDIQPAEIKELRTFREFDEHVTSRLHGFKGADDYYARCSAMPFLTKIECPTLMLHAADDPFMDSRVIPDAKQLSACTAYELSAYGGHVGFMGKDSRFDVSTSVAADMQSADKLWLPFRITRFLEEHL